MPGPGAGDDGGQVGLARRKAQVPAGQGDVGDQMRRIASAAFARYVGQPQAAMAHDRRQNLTHRMALAGAEIVGRKAAASIQQLRQGRQMSLGQV